MTKTTTILLPSRVSLLYSIAVLAWIDPAVVEGFWWRVRVSSVCVLCVQCAVYRILAVVRTVVVCVCVYVGTTPLTSFVFFFLMIEQRQRRPTLWRNRLPATHGLPYQSERSQCFHFSNTNRCTAGILFVALRCQQYAPHVHEL